MGKNEKVGKNFLLQNGAIRGLQIDGLQIGAALGISNRDKKITNQGRDFKSGQGLQIGAEHSIDTQRKLFRKFYLW